MNTTDGWLKLSFGSCEIRQTRSLGALLTYSICNIKVFFNYMYDTVAHAQFMKVMVGRSRVLYIYSSWKMEVRDSPECYQNQHDDFTTTTHNPYVRGNYITRKEGGVRYA